VASNVRVRWQIATHCGAFSVGPADQRGLYPAWFCDRRPWHRGVHRDVSRAAVWPR
jgi:hypothetical protein